MQRVFPPAETIAIFTLTGCAIFFVGRYDAKKKRRGEATKDGTILRPAERTPFEDLAFPSQSGLFFLARNSELT